MMVAVSLFLRSPLLLLLLSSLWPCADDTTAVSLLSLLPPISPSAFVVAIAVTVTADASTVASTAVVVAVAETVVADASVLAATAVARMDVVVGVTSSVVTTAMVVVVDVVAAVSSVVAPPTAVAVVDAAVSAETKVVVALVVVPVVASVPVVSAASVDVITESSGRQFQIAKLLSLAFGKVVVDSDFTSPENPSGGLARHYQHRVLPRLKPDDYGFVFLS